MAWTALIDCSNKYIQDIVIMHVAIHVSVRVHMNEDHV